MMPHMTDEDFINLKHTVGGHDGELDLMLKNPLGKGFSKHKSLEEPSNKTDDEERDLTVVAGVGFEPTAFRL
jgi:hypothetical protein